MSVVSIFSKVVRYYVIRLVIECVQWLMKCIKLTMWKGLLLCLCVV